MANDRDPQRSAGLQAGMIVKDEFGSLKEVTRIEGDKVYWKYTEAPLSVSAPGETATDYAEFADRHYMTPFSAGGTRKAA